MKPPGPGWVVMTMIVGNIKDFFKGLVIKLGKKAGKTTVTAPGSCWEDERKISYYTWPYVVCLYISNEC